MPAGHHEVFFPDVIAAGAQGGPLWRTSVAEKGSGFEQRNQRWRQHKGRWNVGPGLRDYDDFLTLQDFFNARQARTYSFNFKDWADYAAVDEPAQNTVTGLTTGDGSTTTFQAQIVATDSGGSAAYKVLKIRATTGVLKVDGTPVSASFSTTTGIFTASVAPAGGTNITASFEFYKPVRFDTDHLDTTYLEGDLFQLLDVPIIEVPL